MDKDTNDSYNIQYYDEDEKNEIRDIEVAWVPKNKFSSTEEERLRIKLKESALHTKKKKDSKITFRLPKDDLIGLKAKAQAQRTGIDYQPLLAALIHKYVRNEIKVEL